MAVRASNQAWATLRGRPPFAPFARAAAVLAGRIILVDAAIALAIKRIYIISIDWARDPHYPSSSTTVRGVLRPACSKSGSTVTHATWQNRQNEGTKDDFRIISRNKTPWVRLIMLKRDSIL